MRLIPYVKYMIPTGRSKARVVNILSAYIDDKVPESSSPRPRTKPYVGQLSDEGFVVSPRSPFSSRASLRLEGRFSPGSRNVIIRLRIFWTAVDYLLNGAVLFCFGAMSFFCLRHALHRHDFQIYDLIPVGAFLLAYLLIMMMFNMSADYRKREIADLFSNQFPE